METCYIEGEDWDFVAFIKEKGIGGKARLETIDGKYRWVITEEDGTEYIARPISSKV